jgi:hypothetical protein
MVGFLEDVTAATDSVIGEVEAVGIPDVEDGQAAADAVLSALRDSQTVFADARDRVQGLSTADPTAFGEELATLGTDLQSSMSGIGSELDQFASPELDEASKDIPECQEVALGGIGGTRTTSYTGRTTTYGGVLASSRACIAWEKRAEIRSLVKRRTNTSANDEYALAA